MRLPDHIAAKSLAVLAAVCFVIAFALANLLPTVTQLGRLVTMASPTMLPAVHDFLHAYRCEWMWDWLLVPLLLRPCWLVPLALGLILAGAAVTAASHRRVPGSPRWRN
jgi:hypothetical protein